jgi:outer membrane protein OmpA-like peptidoglycan-associated protein
MNYKLVITILLASFLQSSVFGQSETYTVKKAPFSSDKYNEFSPVYYKNGIVFCTDRNLSLLNYSTVQNKRLIKINYIDTTGNAETVNQKLLPKIIKTKSGNDTTGSIKWEDARLFSKSLTSKYNDGPVTFNSKRDTIYFSRNLEVNTVLHDVSSPRNKLGIFYATLDGNNWTKIREFRINNEWYNVTTPYLSPDGRKLYFASDKPGGFGGSDLYYCQWKDDYWNDPVNLGPNINTKGNEAYPFITPTGELLFSSDGHPGLGGKDIFFSRFIDTTWQVPVHLEAPINSDKDDFGIISDSLMNSGYFSSNRDGSFDIFHFRTNYPQIFYSSLQRENQYCFIFSDSGAIEIDNLNLEYVWDFGDGNKVSGITVEHSYSGPGKYYVKLDIIDRATGNLFFSKLAFNVEVKDFEQPYINSPNVSVKGTMIDFDGLKSYFPGHKIQNYSWDFGDGTRERGERVKHSFKEEGEYMVNLELTVKNDSTNKVNKTGSSKRIIVVNDSREESSRLKEILSAKSVCPDIRKYSNALIKPRYSAEKEFKQDVVFQVELISSAMKLDLKSTLFSFVPKKYIVEEFFNSDSGTYSYIVDQQMNLMATYIAYKEMESTGYKNVKTKIEILKDPAAKDLNNVKKVYGTLTDSYFDSYNRLTSSAYLLLDQIVKIMNKYPGINLEIMVHTDNTGAAEEKLSLSQTYAQAIINYMINRGINSKRLVALGFGASRPIAPNFLEKDRKLNRRIDFKIIK